MIRRMAIYFFPSVPRTTLILVTRPLKMYIKTNEGISPKHLYICVTPEIFPQYPNSFLRFDLRHLKSRNLLSSKRTFVKIEVRSYLMISPPHYLLFAESHIFFPFNLKKSPPLLAMAHFSLLTYPQDFSLFSSSPTYLSELALVRLQQPSVFLQTLPLSLRTFIPLHQRLMSFCSLLNEDTTSCLIITSLYPLNTYNFSTANRLCAMPVSHLSTRCPIIALCRSLSSPFPRTPQLPNRAGCQIAQPIDRSCSNDKLEVLGSIAVW